MIVEGLAEDWPLFEIAGPGNPQTAEGDRKFKQWIVDTFGEDSRYIQQPETQDDGTYVYRDLLLGGKPFVDKALNKGQEREAEPRSRLILQGCTSKRLRMNISNLSMGCGTSHPFSSRFWVPRCASLATEISWRVEAAVRTLGVPRMWNLPGTFNAMLEATAG